MGVEPDSMAENSETLESEIEQFILLEPEEALELVEEGRIDVECGRPTEDDGIDWNDTGIEIRGGPIQTTRVRDVLLSMAAVLVIVLSLTGILVVLPLLGQGSVSLGWFL